MGLGEKRERALRIGTIEERLANEDSAKIPRIIGCTLLLFVLSSQTIQNSLNANKIAFSAIFKLFIALLLHIFSSDRFVMIKLALKRDFSRIGNMGFGSAKMTVLEMWYGNLIKR